MAGGLLDNSRKFVMHWRVRCQKPCFCSKLPWMSSFPDQLNSACRRGFSPHQDDCVEAEEASLWPFLFLAPYEGCASQQRGWLQKQD